MSLEPIPGNPGTKVRYTWPWFVLGLVVLGMILSVLWMSKEINRTRRLRDTNSPVQTR